MTNQALGSVILALLLLMLSANLAGQLFTRLRQPKVVGEIVAGVLLGPTLLQQVAPGFSAGVFGAGRSDPRSVVLGFFSNFGPGSRARIRGGFRGPCVHAGWCGFR